MHFPALLVLATGAVAHLASESIDDLVESLAAVRKRQLVSCETSYGKGSINCGDSTFCYNPSIGQSCCSKTDFGFCEKGSYCAPVAGFCCMEGESLTDCAKAGGFQLPATVTQSITQTIMVPPKSSSSSLSLAPPSPPPPPASEEPCTTESAFPLPATTVPGPVVVSATVPVVPYPLSSGKPSVVVVGGTGTGGLPTPSRPAIVVTAGAAGPDRRLFGLGAVLGVVVAVAVVL